MDNQYYTPIDLNEQLLSVLELCALYVQLLSIIATLIVLSVLGLLVLRALAQGKLPIEDIASFAEELEQTTATSKQQESEVDEHSDEVSHLQGNYSLLRGLIYN